MEGCKKKVLHTCLSCFYIDNYAYQENMLPKYHVKMGFDVTVLASLVSFNSEGKSCLLKKESIYIDKNGYKVIRINYKKCLFNKISRILRIYSNTENIIEQEQPDIIFIHGGAFWDVRKIIKYKKQHPSVRLFVDSHTDYINSAQNCLSKNVLHKIIWRHTHQLLLPYTEMFWGVTPLRCDFLRLEYQLPKEKIQYLPMGIDDEAIPSDRINVRNHIRNKLGITDDDFVIVTGGKIDERKNIHHLLNTLLSINNSSIHVIIFGVIVPEMQDVFASYVHNNNFHFVGWAKDKDIISYLVSSDLACYVGTHSTLWEESVGIGIPCIFKRWDRMEHVNINGNCVFVKGEDEHELLECIKSLTDVTMYNNIYKKALVASTCFRYSDIAKRAIMAY